MPILRSGYKTVRQDKKRRLRNQAVATELKHLSDKIEKLLNEKKASDAESKIQLLSRLLDRAAVKGIIPKSRASRKKSRLKVRLNRLQSAKA
ncbi:MAG: 30S ribosomal protein S20 [Candidatus Omnitrophica bacterium]|nr:30S ribosomal protein S20 [Candidatus Omnitrophota bacterium]